MLAGLYYGDSVLRVHNIILQGTKKGEEISGLKALEGERMWLLNEDEAASFIKIRNTYIKNITITKQYPNTLLTKVEYFKPLAILHTQEGYFLLSEEAVILEKSREEISKSLPVITYYQDIPFSLYQAGQQLNFKEIQDSIYFLQKLGSMRMPVISIDIQGFHMLGLYTSDEVFFFSSEKDRKQQEYQLEATIKEFGISGRKIKTLDVRFDKPVVRLME